MQISASVLEQIAGAQRRRVGWLLLAHLPAVFVGVWAGWLWALLWVFALHMLLLWATLNPHSTLFGNVIDALPVTEMHGRDIWLTIDDGPSLDTLAMLALLQKHQSRATFFLVASRARQHPDLVRAIIDAGHDIGNHSASHPSNSFWALLPARMTREIVDAQHTLTELAGKAPRWFRAVAGHTNPFVEPVLSALRLQRVAWSVRAYDAVDSNVQRVVNTLANKLKPGAIMLLHEGAAHGRSVAMLEGLLQQMAARGYRTQLPS